ncbi:MAG: hypothetical protein Q4C34_01520 [Bacteroidales bacterium]|nr:hypothetical protein [Bacteroidales bacterium]
MIYPRLTPQQIIDEDRRRRCARPVGYNPVVGDSADPGRVGVATPLPDMPRAYVPRQMVDDPLYPSVLASPAAWRRLRVRHDFEYWCATAVTVKHKTLGTDVRLVLNEPQRRVAAILEADRRAGRPMRMIMLKARQWGGSTLVQVYMAWIQLVHCRNWHSIICSQVKDTSSGIRGMYAKLLENYPDDLRDDDGPLRFRPYERSTNVREIAGRGCRVTVSSIENQDAVRGADFAMAHLSETAFWRATPTHSPDDVIRAICGSIALLPDTLVVMESTANGVGNFFHSEWMRCRDGHGDKHAVFVPWYEIEIYRLEPDDPVGLAASLTDYELWMWHDLRLALDQIWWYRCKSREYASHEKMMAEFPTTDSEAFAATSCGVFDRSAVDRLRLDCIDGRRGDLGNDGRWADDPLGPMLLWQKPADGRDYIVAVDIGGRSAKADWSVITVLRNDTVRPEVVAQWRGHTDHDLLADHAAEIAAWYGNALLAIESNTLETTGSGHGAYILDRLADTYPNLYYRPGSDGEPSRPGFHTNRRTKEMVISGLISAVRRGAYVERDNMACDELLTYETLPDGTCSAKPGCHDDILMSRAIAIYVADRNRPSPPIDPAYFHPSYW